MVELETILSENSQQRNKAEFEDASLTLKREQEYTIQDILDEFFNLKLMEKI